MLYDLGAAKADVIRDCKCFDAFLHLLLSWYWLPVDIIFCAQAPHVSAVHLEGVLDVKEEFLVPPVLEQIASLEDLQPLDFLPFAIEFCLILDSLVRVQKLVAHLVIRPILKVL